MSEDLVGVGDKLHVASRRLFEEDLRRHFVGEVVRVSGVVAELKGYGFVFNPSLNSYARLPEVRNRFFSLADGLQSVHRIPREVTLSALVYEVVGKHVVVTDEKAFSLTINEFGVRN